MMKAKKKTVIAKKDGLVDDSLLGNETSNRQKKDGDRGTSG